MEAKSSYVALVRSAKIQHKSTMKSNLLLFLYTRGKGKGKREKGKGKRKKKRIKLGTACHSQVSYPAKNNSILI